MKRYLLAILIAGCAGIALAQDHPSEAPPSRPSPRMARPDPMARLKLTDEQKSQMKELRFETAKKEIDLQSKLALSKLELGRLFASDQPDRNAIEKKMNEVAANKTALEMNKINGWFEANKLLTPDQQKEWREVLRHEVRERMRRGEHERSEEMEHERER